MILSEPETVAELHIGDTKRASLQTIKRSCHSKRASAFRRAAVVIELALVAPLLLLISLGLIEVSRNAMVQQTLDLAAHAAGRAISAGAEHDQALRIIDQIMGSASIAPFKVKIIMNSRDNTHRADVSVKYSDIAWISFLGLKRGERFHGTAEFPNAISNY